MATRQFEKALAFLENVLVAPTMQNVGSKIMVEAYKKWLLVSLLQNGTAPALPKATNQSSFKHIRALAKAYECVVDAFKSGNLSKLTDEIMAGSTLWESDYNLALVQEVYDAFSKFSIQRLGKTFASLPITEVTRRTMSDRSSQDMITYLQQLISTGELSAVVRESGGVQMLNFLPSTSKQKSEGQVEQELVRLSLELQFTAKQLLDNDHRLELSKEYIEYLKKLKKAKSQDKSGSGRAPFEDVDEDLMMEV